MKKFFTALLCIALMISLAGCETAMQKLFPPPTPTPCAHENWEWWVLLRASRKNEGEQVKKCLDCGEKFDKEVIPKLLCLHEGAFDDEVIKEPTATEEGLKKSTCRLCGVYSVEKPIEPLGFDLNTISQMYAPSIFKVYAYDYSTKSQGFYTQKQGTGFFIDNKGTFITNAHVVENCSDIEVLINGKKYKAGEPLYYDYTNTDLAILRLKKPMETTPVTFSEDVDEYDKVYALGFPNDAPQMLTTGGTIQSNAYIVDGVAYYLFDADVDHGSSGGVLSDRHGNVIGVVTLGWDNGINGALKYAFFKHLVENFKEK